LPFTYDWSEYSNNIVRNGSKNIEVTESSIDGTYLHQVVPWFQPMFLSGFLQEVGGGFGYLNLSTLPSGLHARS
jgi:hypothetical protein